MRVVGQIGIPDEEIRLTYCRASGPGGQNVNKLATAACLRVAVEAIHGLDEDGLRRLAVLAGKRLTVGGELLLRAECERTQEGNRRAVLERLRSLVAQAAKRPGTRKPTVPTRAARERRLDAKTRRGRLKRSRRENFDD